MAKKTKKKAKKKAAKKKAGKKKAGKKKASTKKSPTKTVAKNETRSRSARPRPRGSATATFTAAASKTVTFTNNSPNVIVRIDVGGKRFIVGGTKAGSFPPGTYDPLTWAAQGSGPYEVTVAGATTFAPISGNAPGGGVTVMEVP